VSTPFHSRVITFGASSASCFCFALLGFSNVFLAWWGGVDANLSMFRNEIVKLQRVPAGSRWDRATNIGRGRRLRRGFMFLG